MKRIFLITMLLFNAAFIGISSVSQDEDYTIEILRTTDAMTRGLELNNPSGEISGAILTLSFQSSGNYELHIKNSLGIIVYISTLPADGMEYIYDLSGIGGCMFRLVLDGPGGMYEGYFTIN